MSRPTFVRAGAAVIAVAAATSLAACGGGDSGGGSSASASDTVTVALDADAAPNGYDPLLYSQGQYQFFSCAVRRAVRHRHRRAGPAEPGHRLLEQPGQPPAHPDAAGRRHVHRRLDARLDAGQGEPRRAQRHRPADQRHARRRRLAGDHRRRRARPEDRRHHLGEAAGAGRDRARRHQRHHRRRGRRSPTATTLEPPSPTGPGPYTLDAGKTTKGSTYTLDKNAKAWNADNWSYDTIVFKVITDPQALANAVVSGQADVGRAARPDHGRPGRLQAEHRRRSAASSSASRSPTRPARPTRRSQDPNVRLALSYGIDREAIVKDLHPASKATAQLFPSDSPGFDASLERRSTPTTRTRPSSCWPTPGYPDLSIDMTVLRSARPRPARHPGPVEADRRHAELRRPRPRPTSSSPRQPPSRCCFGPFGVGSQPAGFVAGVVVGGFMNLQKANDPAIEAVAGRGARCHR